MELYPEAMQKYFELTVVPRQPCHCNVLTCACVCRSLLDGRYQTSACLSKFSLLTELIGISLSQKVTSVSHFLSHDVVYS